MVGVALLAALSIVKTGPAAPVEAGQGFSYTITVTNTGATPLTFDLSDPLPAETVFYSLWVDGSPPGGQVDCHLPTYETNDAPIECVYTNLAPQASAVFDVYAAVRYCLPSGIEVVNTATASDTASQSSSWSFFTLEQTDPYCNDYNGCTEYDQCYEGYCEGQPINGCPDGSVCTIDGCDPQTGCTYEEITCPDDGNACTVPDCDPITGCFQANEPAGTACPFTGPCMNTGVCDGQGTCTGVSVCNDGNPCTLDFADAQNACACSYQAVTSGTACDDGSVCTANDACNGSGTCQGTPVGVVPGDIGNTVRVNKGGTVAGVFWTTIPNADFYQVLKGNLSTLPVGSGSPDETCLAPEQYGGGRDDFAVPASGTGFWYVVRGVNSCAGPGPYGFQGNHGLPGSPRISTTCP